MTGLTLRALQDAYDMVCWGGIEDKTAYVCRRSGRVYVSGWDEEIDEVPEDIDDPELYAVLPSKDDLDLGTALVLEFASEEGPELRARVEGIFRSRGAYGRFKDLLAREGRLDRWHDFEARRVERALREWCEDEGLVLSEEAPAAVDGQTSPATSTADRDSAS